MEKRNVVNEDFKEHDENEDAIEMRENKEVLITEKIFLEWGRL